MEEYGCIKNIVCFGEEGTLLDGKLGTLSRREEAKGVAQVWLCNNGEMQ